MSNYENPFIVQSDRSILVETASPLYETARSELIRFAELIKSPEHIHTYSITTLSIWNACASGLLPEDIIKTLIQFAKYSVPEHIIVEIRDFASRYGRIKLTRNNDHLILTTQDEYLAEQINRDRRVTPYLKERLSKNSFQVSLELRGPIKQALIKIGFPAEDLAGYSIGDPLPIQLRKTSLTGAMFEPRDYQKSAADIFYAGGGLQGGSGVIVLPCGAGKTIVGIACMEKVQTSTLILATNVTALRQWIHEILDKTSLTPDQVGEYSGNKKEIRPVTVTTYNILTYRESAESEFKHMPLFDEHNWGFIIYDEVHLLPAPVFQMTASLQARRRLGLTATLVREDGRENDVFALIGPKKLDIPWKEIEKQGWIAKAQCTEFRIPMPKQLQMSYAVADARKQFRIASENPDKIKIIRNLIRKHQGDKILIIGMYVEQLNEISNILKIPVISGTTNQKRRDELFSSFQNGELSILAVSKVANFSLDLPDATVAIQISGTFGSRQEEAQRLGRILRPKSGANRAYFYTIVSHETTEQEFASKRQLFLCEQGYEYQIISEHMESI